MPKDLSQPLTRCFVLDMAMDTHKVATPVNWRPGGPVIGPPPMTTERVADGYECVDSYRVRSGLREMAAAGIVAEESGRFSAT